METQLKDIPEALAIKPVFTTDITPIDLIQIVLKCHHIRNPF